MFKSLMNKIMTSYLIPPLLILLLLFFLLPHFLELFFLDSQKQELQEKAQNIKTALPQYDRGDIGRLLHDFEEMLGTGIIILDNQGQMTGHGSRMQHMMPEERRTGQMRGMHSGHRNTVSFDFDLEKLLESSTFSQQVLAGQNISFQGWSPLLETEIIGVALSLDEFNSGEILLLVSSQTDLQQTIYQIRNLILFTAGIAIILSLLLSYFLARGIVKPVKDIKTQALQLAQGEYDTRLQNLPANEIGSLGETINYLAQRLEENIAKLNEESKKMQGMLNSMVEGVLGVSSSGEIITFNPRLKKMFGQNMFHKKAAIQQKVPQEIKNSINQVLENKEINKSEFKWQDRYFVVRGAPIFQQDKFSGAIFLFQDVTELMKLEEMRRLFVANVSHELKTPLTSIQGYLEAMLDGMIEGRKEREKYLNKILEESKEMNHLIKDLLDLSSLQSGQSEFDYQEFDLSQLLYSVIYKFENLSEKRKLILNIPEGIKIKSDPDRLRQVFLNLLSNAVKFTTKDDEIKIVVQQKDGEIKIEFSDQGIGIPQQELPYIWERFYQIDRARNPQKEGTGLGLAITKEIIEGLNGEINVTSQLDRGTTFEIYLKNDKS